MRDAGRGILCVGGGGLVPAVEVGGDFGELAAVEGGFLDAASLLLAVVVEQTEGVFAQDW